MARQDIIEKYSYLIGNKVNQWTVMNLEKMVCNNDSARLYASCECECGTVKPVLVKNLIKNLSKNCGCERKKTIGKLFSKDLVDKKFGKLLVVEDLQQRSASGHKLYRCRCDCGNEIILQTNVLTTGHTNSCGCLISYYNMYIEQLLTNKNIIHKSEYTVYINENYYRFDFYLPEYNLFIEYDGKQHFEPTRFYNQSDEEMQLTFELTKKRDKIKDMYCQENNINLLRIPYCEKENIETIIINHLQRLNEKGFANVA